MAKLIKRGAAALAVAFFLTLSPAAAEEAPKRQPISDAEIQRTADKVYRILEERLRRELRRSGR